MVLIVGKLALAWFRIALPYFISGPVNMRLEVMGIYASEQVTNKYSLS